MKKIVIYITSILFTLILGIFIGKLFFNDKKDTVISNNPDFDSCKRIKTP